MKFAPQLQANLYGPAHLWFLLYLYVICLLYGIFRRLLGCCTIKGTRLSPCLDRVPASPWFPLLVSIPTGLIVAFAPETVYGFHNSFCPEPSRLVYYGLFFVAGTWLARIRAVLDIFLIPWCGFNLLICVPLALANGLLLHNYLHGNLTQYGRAALGTTCALLASFSLFGLLGLAQMLCRRENALLRFLADSSYWVYLIHFPLIGLGHVLLTHVPGLALLKFCLVAGVTMAFGLWTYARLVRGRVLGRLLNGTRTVKERKPFLSPAQERPREAA
jgi:peptidoglycan/LPS O-acetylase OafA/YrhL